MSVNTACPVCKETRSSLWAHENGWTAVRCASCGCVYVNPRPAMEDISQAARTGLHPGEDRPLKTTGSALFWRSKVANFDRCLRQVLTHSDLVAPGTRWLDVGCGYGELLVAARQLLPRDAQFTGIEPSAVKRRFAASRGLTLLATPLEDIPPASFDVVSSINVLSHVPEPVSFLHQVARILTPGGLLLLVTGNGADIERSEYPGILDLPDHLIFFGESGLMLLLEKCDFDVLPLDRFRLFFLEPSYLRILKNIARRALRRPVVPSDEGTSRALFVRARTRSTTR